MGEIRVIIRLKNADDLVLFRNKKIKKSKIRSAEITAVADTGAVMVLLPQDLVERLGLRYKNKVIVTLATEEKRELHIAGNFLISIAGREWETDCLVGPPQCEPLIGQLVLERLDLIVDPLKQTLTPRPESPYLPSLKLK